LILGAGEMGERALLAFLSRGDCRVLLANRTNSRALALGKVPAVTAIPWEAWEAHMSTADVIVGCTGAQSPLVVPKQFSSDRSGPQLFIDLGLPRNFDSNIEQVPGIHLVDLDGLEGLAGNSESNPALIEAERLAEEMASRCQERLLSFNADPVIRQLIAFAETEREQMLHNFLKRRKGLLERDAEAALRLFSSQLQKKLLHEPISRIKSASPSERVLLLGILTKTPSAAETAPPHEKPFRPFSRAPKQRSLIPWPEHKLSR
jgi:glutamyl-tRNA reductase